MILQVHICIYISPFDCHELTSLTNQGKPDDFHATCLFCLFVPFLFLCSSVNLAALYYGICVLLSFSVLLEWVSIKKKKVSDIGITKLVKFTKKSSQSSRENWTTFHKI